MPGAFPQDLEAKQPRSDCCCCYCRLATGLQHPLRGRGWPPTLCAPCSKLPAGGFTWANLLWTHHVMLVICEACAGRAACMAPEAARLLCAGWACMMWRSMLRQRTKPQLAWRGVWALFTRHGSYVDARAITCTCARVLSWSLCAACSGLRSQTACVHAGHTEGCADGARAAARFARLPTGSRISLSQQRWPAMRCCAQVVRTAAFMSVSVARVRSCRHQVNAKARGQRQ